MNKERGISKILIEEKQINEKVKELAKRISDDYSGKENAPCLVGLLKGSFIFIADLSRYIDIPIEIDFMIVSSYGNNQIGSEIKILKDIDVQLSGRDVIIVEDIIDTGYTLEKICEVLQTRNIASLKICALLNKSCKKYPFKKVIELNIMTKFFNGITPFSLGGQPLQVYELSKNKVPVTKSILVIVENFIILQITMSVMIILSLIFGYMFELRPNNFLYIMTLIGALITIVSFVITILICVKIELASSIGKNMINLLNKFNIIKDKETTLNKWNSKCIEYQNGFKNLMKDKKFIIKCVCVNFIYMTVFFMIPFFTLKALHITLNINMFYVIILSCFVYISASFIPMPGSSISTEYSFIHYFSLIACETID